MKTIYIFLLEEGSLTTSCGMRIGRSGIFIEHVAVVCGYLIQNWRKFIMLDVKHNYLIGSSQPLPSNYNIDDRPDPDTDGCIKLYDDIIEAYFHGIKDHTFENVEQQFRPDKYKDLDLQWENYKKLNNDNPLAVSKGKQPPVYTVFVDKGTPNEFLLSADYFGPSIYWAVESGINDKQIREFLQISRTIGGHMVWPRGKDIKHKINPSRAAVYDRPDWTLLLLKIYFEKRDEKAFLEEANKLIPIEFRGKENFNSKFIKIYLALCDSSKWIDFIESFENFCITFKLLGSFVDDNFNVISLADLFPLLPKDYKGYIKNTCQAIIQRAEKIALVENNDWRRTNGK